MKKIMPQSLFPCTTRTAFAPALDEPQISLRPDWLHLGALLDGFKSAKNN